MKLTHINSHYGPTSPRGQASGRGHQGKAGVHGHECITPFDVCPEADKSYDEPDDPDFARREAEELLDKLNEK